MPLVYLSLQCEMSIRRVLLLVQSIGAQATRDCISRNPIGSAGRVSIVHINLHIIHVAFLVWHFSPDSYSSDKQPGPPQTARWAGPRALQTKGDPPQPAVFVVFLYISGLWI